MGKELIQNRKGQKIVSIIKRTENQKGLVFVIHGLGGFKEQPHIQTMAEAFKDKEYTVITFDATNSLGESDGNIGEATLTNYYEDLEDVIDWSKNQKWYQEPFCLAGHSLGGICSILFAQKYPEKIKALAPISTVVSGQLRLEANRKENEQWKREGF